MNHTLSTEPHAPSAQRRRFPNLSFLCCLLLAASLLAASAASAAITIDTVLVGNPGNANDSTGLGGVSYSYHIGTYEVTNAQYATFLNSVAATDTFGLYSTNMAGSFGGISRSGTAGSFTYTAVNPNTPVNFVSFWDATRFTNWLTTGNTETGVYYLGSIPRPPNSNITRNETAWLAGGFAIASENEWYKAAYYDPTLNSGTGGYWRYPTQSNSITTADANYNILVNNVTAVGTYAAAPSYYGTFDQGGNVWEWNDSIPFFDERRLRGGSFTNLDNGLSLQSSEPSARLSLAPTFEGNNVGFRISRLALTPEPSANATHWLGQTNANWSSTNWASDAAGTATTAIPTSTSDITFSATGAQNSTTTLGQDFTIQSLTVNSTAGIGGNNALTITGATKVANGTLTLNNGVTVTSQTSSRVEATGAGATAIVTGFNSKWNTTGGLNVGFDPDQTGTLNVLSGGNVTADSLTAGGNPGATGTVTVSGFASTLTTNSISIGSSGNGTLNIESGGVVTTNGSAGIGQYEGSVGVATVSGFGSKWIISEDLTIDSGGDGTLNIRSGGVVSNRNAYLATSSALNAAVTVDGFGSEWISTGETRIGEVGPASLNITNGGKVSSEFILMANFGDATVTVDGSGSLWNGGILTMGNAGNSTLAIKKGGAVTMDTVYGSGPQSTLTVEGSGSRLVVAEDLTVGGYGNSTLTVSNGGLVTVGNGTGTLTLGAQAGSNGTLNIGTFGGNSTAGSLTAAEVMGGLGNATLNFNQTGAIAFAPKITGSTKVNQLGNGTTTLTGSGNYTGPTTVSAGSLFINGNNLAATGNVTVQNGGTLGGSGTIGGNITVQSGGTITAGSNASSTGLLTGTNLTLASGSTALFQLAGTNDFDSIRANPFASGNITLSLQLTGSYTGKENDSFRIFQADSYDIGSANFNIATNLGDQFKWDLTGLASSGTVKIALTSPPGLPATHWLGQSNSTWSGTNWASDAAGNATTAIPTSTSDITFSATGATNQTPITLDVDATIQSLTVNNSAGLSGSKTLTITGATTVNNGTLSLLSGTVKVEPTSDGQINAINITDPSIGGISLQTDSVLDVNAKNGTGAAAVGVRFAHGSSPSTSWLNAGRLTVTGGSGNSTHGGLAWGVYSDNFVSGGSNSGSLVARGGDSSSGWGGEAIGVYGASGVTGFSIGSEIPPLGPGPFPISSDFGGPGGGFPGFIIVGPSGPSGEITAIAGNGTGSGNRGGAAFGVTTYAGPINDVLNWGTVTSRGGQGLDGATGGAAYGYYAQRTGGVLQDSTNEVGSLVEAIGGNGTGGGGGDAMAIGGASSVSNFSQFGSLRATGGSDTGSGNGGVAWGVSIPTATSNRCLQSWRTGRRSLSPAAPARTAVRLSASSPSLARLTMSRSKEISR